MATTSKTGRPKRGRTTKNLGLLAIGSSGSWEVSIDETTSGVERWFAQIDGPSVSLYFEIPSPDVVRKVIRVLESTQDSASPSANGARKKNGPISLGRGKKNQVSLIHDDEFADRFFLVVGAAGAAFARITIRGTDIPQLIGALLQVQEDLEADGDSPQQ